MEIIAILIFALILTLDVLYYFVADRFGYLINGINLAMHIALILSLLILDMELKHLLAALLISIFVYTLGFFIKNRRLWEGRDDV